MRVTLGDRGGNQPPPSHIWGESLIVDIPQEVWPEDQITKAVAMSPEEAILFFSRHSRNEGLPFSKARDVEFGLGSPFNWAGRPAQMKVSMKSVQDDHCAIIEAVVEKKTKARGPGQPQGRAKPSKSLATAYDVEEWMLGLEGASNREPRGNNDMNHGVEQQSIPSQ